MKNIFKIGIILAIVCIVSAASLSFVYQQTKPLIDRQREKYIKIAQKEVLPEAVTFESVEVGGRELNIGYNDYGNQKGVVIKNSSRGYSGKINMIIGLNNEGRVEGIKILRHTETPGLGARITQGEFIRQFKGKLNRDLIIKKEDPSGKIDAITGATISSQAVVVGVRECLEWLNKNYYMKGEK